MKICYTVSCCHLMSICFTCTGNPVFNSYTPCMLFRKCSLTRHPVNTIKHEFLVFCKYITVDATKSLNSLGIFFQIVAFPSKSSTVPCEETPKGSKHCSQGLFSEHQELFMPLHLFWILLVTCSHQNAAQDFLLLLRFSVLISAL